jgi:hypothetical protein
MSINSRYDDLLRADRIRTALKDRDYFSFRSNTICTVLINLEQHNLSKDEAFAPDIAWELFGWLVALANDKSSGYIYFGNESFFYFRHLENAVEIYCYSPEEIIDENYRNHIGTVLKDELVDAILSGLLVLRNSLVGFAQQISTLEGPAALSALKALLLVPDQGVGTLDPR